MKRPPLLLHVHMPKTAGSALNQSVLAPRFEQSSVWLAYGVLFERKRRVEPEENAATADLIAGHVPHGYASPLGRKTIHISILRDPVDRVVSFLNFVAQAKRHGAKRRFDVDMEELARRDPSLFASMILSQDHVRLRQSNTMVRLASGLPRLSRKTPGMWRLGLALKNAASDEYLLGVQSGFDAFAATVTARLNEDGIGTQPDVARRVVSDKAGKRLEAVIRRGELSSAVLADIKRLNTLDQRLFDAVAEQGERRIAA